MAHSRTVALQSVLERNRGRSSRASSLYQSGIKLRGSREGRAKDSVDTQYHSTDNLSASLFTEEVTATQLPSNFYAHTGH